MFSTFLLSPQLRVLDSVSLPLEAAPTVKQTKDAAVDNAGKTALGLDCANK